LVDYGILFTLIIAVLMWVLMSHSVFGFQVRVVGSAPNAARHGGFSQKHTIWLVFLISGGLAGLAGIFQVTGPFGQMSLGFPQNYGFTAIIVAFLGRLNPLGVIAAGIVLAITYVGGDIAQTALQLPNASKGIFQAMMLFFLLASDILIRYRVRIVGTSPTTRLEDGKPVDQPPLVYEYRFKVPNRMAESSVIRCGDADFQALADS